MSAPTTTAAAARSRVLCALGLSLAGLLLLLAAASASNGRLELALLGETGTMAWGPALFRALLAWHGLLLIGCSAWVLRVRRPASLEKERSGEEPAALRRKALAALALLLAVALALRVWRLDTCLWLDEVITLVQYVRQPWGAVVGRFPDQNQHMLYSVLSRASFDVFGESAWALRLPAVLLGVASIGAVFALGRFVAGSLEGLLAAALMTFSYHHVWFSQNARGYTGLLLMTVLSTLFFLRGLRSARAGWWVAYAVAIALGLWVHLTMAFVIATQGLVYFGLWCLSWRPQRPGQYRLAPANRWRPLAALVVGATLTLQLYALALPEFLHAALHEVSLPSEWTNPLWVLREMTSGIRLGLGGVAGLLAGSVLMLAGIASLWRKSPVVVLLFLLPGMLGAGLMLAMQHNLWPRFFFFELGFFVIIAVRGAAVLGQLASALVAREASARLAWGRRIGAAGAAAMIAVSAASVPRCYCLPKQDYLGAKAYIQSHADRGDSVVAVGLAAYPCGRYYATDWDTPQTPAELQRIRRQSPRTWLVYSFVPHMRAFCPDLWESVEQQFEVVKVFPGTLRGGEVYVCRSLPQVAARSDGRRSSP